MDLISPVVRRWVQDARENPEAFWGRAAEQLPWFRTWDCVFEWTPPTFRWFIGGQTNLAYNALDHSELGSVAVIGEIKFVNMLPKTRSGKIMRRVLRAVTLERDPGDISTIEDEGSVEEAREVWHQLRAEMTE